MPAVLTPLLSMTILNGNPFALSERAKNCVAAAFFVLEQHEIKRFDELVDRAIEIHPLTLHFHICLIHTPRTIHSALSIWRCFRHEPGIFSHPSVQRCMIQIDASFGHDFFQIPVGDTVARVEEDGV